MKNTVIITLLTICYINLNAQVDTLAVQSIEGITNKMLALISGEIGEQRDWEEYRNLFLPTAQKMSIQETRDGKKRVRTMNLEEFVRYVGPLYAIDGFEEYAIGLTVNEFNGIANVFQSYYCKNLKGTYEKRGINSYQLVHQKNRWWIASVLFVNETKAYPIPNKFLFKKFKSKKNKK